MDYQHIRKGFQILFQLNVIAAIYVLEQNMQGMSDAANLRPRTSAFFPLHYHYDNVMEITTSAKISTPGFKTFQQPCVGEFLSKQFQVIMQLSGTQLKHYQLSKASKFCYQCSIFIHC